MTIEASKLYQALRARRVEIAAGPEDLVAEFDRLRVVLLEHGKYIVTIFPEYTPHDTTRHLDHLFFLADRVLGADLYARLSPAEVALLAFGLYAHDWGMAVSQRELQALRDGTETEAFSLLPGEPALAQRYVAERNTSGRQPDSLWTEYLRVTHGRRSGARLRTYLTSVGSAMAEAVARIAEGHTLDARDIRDVHRYPVSYPVFGEAVNLAALSEYVRIIDLLDIGEDRTPYALWKFVAPLDPTSSTEWSKHRALSPAAVRAGGPLRQVIVGGVTDDPAVYAALADLREWVTSQFATAMLHLRHIGGPYDVDLDSRIDWLVQAQGFEPVLARFELDRDALIKMLGRELYGDAALVFIRELLQNSVDAIEAREDVLSREGTRLEAMPFS